MLLCASFGYGQVINDITKLFPKEDIDSLSVVKDSISSDSIAEKKEKNERLKSEVKYDAEEKITHYYSEEYSELIDKGDITYGDANLKAGYIKIDWKTDRVFATGLPDSTGKKTLQRPIFIQKGDTIYVDSIVYNLKTERALIYDFNTAYEDIIYDGEKVKRISDSVFYLRNARFTTDKDKKPDYYIGTKRAKFIKDDKIITGLARLYIHDVPTPLFLPFGFFPSTSKRKAGVLIPTYGKQRDLGFFLQNLGFYLPIKDYVDLTTLFDFYTNGSWAIDLNTSYALRYRFNGNLNLRYNNTFSGTKGLNDFGKKEDYKLRWIHSQDAKADPNFTFSSSVDIYSSQFFRNSFDRSDILNRKDQTNTTSSSINLTKRFEDFPINDISMSISHSQDNNTRRITMALPSLTVGVKRIYPFASKSGNKKGMLQKLSVNYSFSGENKIEIDEGLFLKKEMFDSARVGMRHRVGITTNTSLFRYLIFKPSINYREHWELATIQKRFDETSRKVVSDRIRGFETFRTYDFNASLSTNLYGIKQFKPGKYFSAIRHTFTPSISYSYRPDFSDLSFGHYDTYLDSLGVEQSYNRFDKSVTVNGGPSSGKQSAINIRLDNNLEAKVRSKEDSTKYEKIKLLDRLNINTSYNFAKDTFKLGNIGIEAGTRIFKDKLDLEATATIDPYPLINDNGKAVRIDQPGKAFRLTNFTLSGSYQLNNETFTKKKEEEEKSPNNSNEVDREEPKKKGGNDPFTYDKDGYAKFAIPWNLSLGYHLRYPKSGFEPTIISTLNLNGEIQFTPYWSMSGTIDYDFNKSEFTHLRLGFERILRSFKLTFDWEPFTGVFFFTFSFRNKILQDLKYDKRDFRN